MSAPLSRQRLWALTFLTVLAAYTLFAGLGAGAFEVYDEGLYGMYAQNALHHDSWLHAVDTHGKFPDGATRYSKPPLVLWLVAASFARLGPISGHADRGDARPVLARPSPIGRSRTEVTRAPSSPALRR